MTPRILKLYTEVLTGFSHVFHPNGLNNPLLSQAYVTETAPSVGTVGRMYISRTGNGGEAGVNWQSCPLHDLLQQTGKPLKFAEASRIFFWKLSPLFYISFHLLGASATFELHSPVKLQIV